LNSISGAVYTFSKNAKTVSHSSTEAEIKAMDALIMFVSHMLDIIKFLEINYNRPVIIFVDNTSSKELCETLKSNSNVKIINVRINYIRELINNRIIELVFIPTADNVADMLTKPLDYTLFNRHCKRLMEGFDGDVVFNKLLNDNLKLNEN
jgi:hypothetical protein